MYLWPLSLILAAAAGALAAGAALYSRIIRLQKKVTESAQAVERTSKLMIEKNVELFDQNVAQQKLLASKDDFIAIASHQLRTPAAEIKWAIGTLLSDSSKPASREDLQKIQASALKMERLIEDLLQFVQVEQGKTRLAVTPYQPDSVVAAAAERTKKDFEGRAIQLSTSLSFGGTIASLDQNALDMLLSNLVENAYHYTPDGGSIAILTRNQDNAFVCEVADTGMGVPEEMREKLFVKFRRSAEAQTRNSEGSGLGLYIIKTIVERAGGTVGYRPHEGGGSVFSFALPLAAQATRTP